MSLLRARVGIFLQIAASGGVTGAARRLRVSQPAVSAQLRELERQLGVPLVDRSRRRFALTEAGQRFLASAERLRAVEEEALQELTAAKGAGRLAVGASETPGHFLLLPALGRFHARHPAVTLDVTIGTSATVAQRVLDGVVELGFVEGPVAEAGLERRAFARDRLRLIVNRRDALARRRRLALRDLAGRDFVMREKSSAVRARIEDAFRKAGFVPRIGFELGTSEAVKRAVAAGLGVAFIPEASLAADVASGRLASPEVPGLDLRRTLWVLTRAGRAPSPAATAFLSIAMP